MLREFGICEQLISDKGPEWAVCAFLQHYAHLRVGRPAYTGGAAAASPSAYVLERVRYAHKYTQSIFNVRVERFNFEVNVRVLIYVRRQPPVPKGTTTRGVYPWG